MVIWITGLSGAGKTTISQNLYKILKPKFSNIVLIDNDEIKNILGTTDFEYDKKSRIIKAKKIQNLSKMLSDQDLIVIVSAIYFNEKISKWNRENFKPYYEILLDISLETVIKRDPKGLYKQFSDGKMKNIVGLDVKWHKPKNPHIMIDEKLTLTESTDLVINKIPQFK